MFYKIQIKLLASENCFHAQTALQAVRRQNHNGSYHILHLNHVGDRTTCRSPIWSKLPPQKSRNGCVCATKYLTCHKSSDLHLQSVCCCGEDEIGMELSESHWKCYVQINTINFLELNVHQDRYLMVICLNLIQQTPLNGSTDHVSADYVILLSNSLEVCAIVNTRFPAEPLRSTFSVV